MITDAVARAHTGVNDELRRACGCMVAGLAIILLLFREEAVDAVAVWRDSTAYNHCFLVIPITAYLLWDRRAELAGLRPRPTPVLGLLALPLSIAWLAAERLGIMEARQLLVLTGFELLVLSILGRHAYWRLCGPLLYLYFLAPFGHALTPFLQDVTAWFVMHGLDLLGIANYTDGLIIQIPEGTFVIADACAGLRFLIASVAFGCLYALLIYRSPVRRLLFIAASVAVPIVANGIRALGIVSLGHLLGSAQAAETDHVLYGWMFFSIVTVILILLGLPFRQDTTGPRRGGRLLETGPRGATNAALAGSAALVLALMASGPAAAAALAIAATVPVRPVTLSAAAEPCRLVSENQRVDAEVPAGISIRRFSCGDMAMNVQIETFSPRTAPRAILHEQDRLTEASGDDAVVRRSVINGLAWHLVTPGTSAPASASLLWSRGRLVEPGIGFRLSQGWNSMVGGGGPILLVVVRPEPAPVPDRYHMVSSLTDFLQAQVGWPSRLAVIAPR